MNLKTMKKTKTTKTSNLVPVEKQQQGMLKDQKNKIQTKLQALRAQITERKKNKNRDQTADTGRGKGEKDPYATNKGNTGSRWRSSSGLDSTHIENFLNSTQSAKNKPKTQSQLQSILIGLKMQKFIELLTNDKKITSVEKLVALTEEDIDEWKDIPVGYRVKLRKFIKEHHAQQQSQQKEEQPEPNNKQMNIEDIIERRKESRVFVPITDKPFDEDEQQSIQQEKSPRKSQGEEEDVLINSLNLAFLGRKGIIKGNNSQHESSMSNSGDSRRKQVKWDEKVIDYNNTNKKKISNRLNTRYPTTSIIKKYQQQQEQQEEVTKKTNQQTGNLQNRAYCWSCLKRIVSQSESQTKKQQGTAHAFCNKQCEEKYRRNTSLQNFQQQISHYSQKIEKLEAEKQTTPQKQYYQEQWSDEDEFIDLGIN